MKEKMLLMLVGIAIEKLDPEDVKKWADMAIDMVEEKIENTETKIDDKVILPLIGIIREAFDIEDND